MLSTVTEREVTDDVSELSDLAARGHSRTDLNSSLVAKSAASNLQMEAPSTKSAYLVRYGSVPEVARFRDDSGCEPVRGATVVVKTHRGLQIGSVLERLKPSKAIDDVEIDFEISRIANDSDLDAARQRSDECEATFADWCARIADWGLQLELIDLEWTLDRDKLIFYVLCDRGPDSTKLALQAAASGFGIIEVQPVSAAGLVSLPSGGSCGSGGGGCGCSH